MLVFLCLISFGGVYGQYTGSGTFTKITSLGELTDGYYVISSGPGGASTVAMTNNNAGSIFESTAISPVSNQLIDPTSNIVWKIETNEGGRTIYSEGTSKYVSYTGSSNNVQVVNIVSANNQRWTFTYEDNLFHIKNMAVTDRLLQYNSNSGQERFACYKASQEDITLYKLESNNPEPTNHPTDFACGTTTSSAIELNWTDAIGGDLPTGYLIRFSSVSFAAIPDPADGTTYTSETYVNQGVQTATITGLLQDTEYFFKIFPYSNSGANIDYKIDGSVETTACITLEGPCEYENFDDITISTGYGTNSFTNDSGTAEYSCVECLRETAGTQDGSFPSTNNDSPRAIRLRDQPGSLFQVKLKEGGMGTFSVFLRRWDNNPSPNHEVEYSINNGTDWTSVQTISNAWLDNSSAYKELVFDVNAVSQAGNNDDDIIVRIRRVGGERIMIDDVSWTCFDGCTATQTISSFAPTSGPQGTMVTVNGSGFTDASGLEFGGVDITTFTVVNDSTLTFLVPATSASGKITITVDGCNRASDGIFTFLFHNNNCGGPSGGGIPPNADLFISNVYDASSGSLSYIEVFNGTLTSKALAPYTIRVRTGTATDTDYPMTGSLPSGGAYILRIGTSTSSCAEIGSDIIDNRPTAPGFNGNDQIFLLKDGVDLDYAPNPNSIFAGGTGTASAGFSQARKNTVTSPTTTYDPNEWLISDEENCSNLGIPPYDPGGATITITDHPVSVFCEMEVTFSVNATATATIPGTNGYIWRYHAPNAADWQAISSLSLPGVSVVGAGTSSITITGNTALIKGYQFYVDIGAGSPQCRRYSNVAIYDYDSKPFYRTIASGNWMNTESWQMSDTEIGGYIPVCQPPTALSSEKIIIEHDVVLNYDLTVSWVIVEDGHQLELANTTKLTIENGNPLGSDLEILGTMVDRGSSGNGISFEPGSTWSMDSGATLVKTNNSSVANYRNNYEGGIATIPADAHWIYRRTPESDLVAVVAADMTYPNLTFENMVNDTFEPTSSLYVFYGSTNPPVIKGNLDIGGNGSGNYIVRNNHTNLITAILVEGDLIIRPGSGLRNVNSSTSHSGTGFEVRGNLQIDGSLDLSAGDAGRGILRIAGDEETVLSGSGSVVVNELTIAKTNSANVHADLTITSKRSTTLSGGLLVFTSGYLALDQAATISAGSAASFVGGMIRKNGFANTNEVIFPVGDVSLNNADPEDDYIYFQPASLTPAAAGATAFTVQYFHHNFNSTYNPATLGLNKVSTCNYWIIDRVSGSGHAQVGLSWNEDYCFDVTEPEALTVARYNALAEVWEDAPYTPGVSQSNSGGPEYTTGWIKTIPVVQNFSPFAIGAIGLELNVLPITLVSFSAKAIDDNLVETNWITASEKNNEYFTVERSINGVEFEVVGRVMGAGTSTSTLNYTFNDERPHKGISFYRLRQTDYDGTFTFSDVVSVQIGDSNSAFDLEYVYRSDVGVELGYTAISPYLTVEIFDLTGRRLFGDILENNEGRSLIQPKLAEGIYMIRLSQGRETVTKKFFYYGFRQNTKD